MKYVRSLQVMGQKHFVKVYAMLSDGCVTKVDIDNGEALCMCRTIYETGFFAVSPSQTFACGSYRQNKISIYSKEGMELDTVGVSKPQWIAATVNHFVVVNERFEAFTLDLDGKCERYSRDARGVLQLGQGQILLETDSMLELYPAQAFFKKGSARVRCAAASERFLAIGYFGGYIDVLELATGRLVLRAPLGKSALAQVIGFASESQVMFVRQDELPDGDSARYIETVSINGGSVARVAELRFDEGYGPIHGGRLYASSGSVVDERGCIVHKLKYVY